VTFVNKSTQPTREQKPYSKPEIIHELELETRAGSPLTGIDTDPLDLIGVDTEGLNGG
jgi:hypothetical protein